MKILYIEDDPIDTQSCRLIMGGMDGLVLEVVDDFEKALGLLEKEDFNMLISDQRVGMDDFEEYWSHFLGLPYHILSNSPSSTLMELPYPPLHAYSKPITAEMIAEMLESVEGMEPLPNMSYAERITEGAPEMLVEMVMILRKQFEEGKSKIPYLYESGNKEELIQVIHKLISKFSVLSMEDSFRFFNLTEKCLRDDLPLNGYTYRRLVRDLGKGLAFINHYIELHELHNS